MPDADDGYGVSSATDATSVTIAIMMAAHKEQDGNPMYLRAVALLEKAAALYPDDYKYPQLAGEVYVVDLFTKEPATRRGWEERGAQLLESAVRKPNAVFLVSSSVGDPPNDARLVK